MIDMRFLIAAIAIMLIIIVREVLKKRYNFDMDQVDVNKSSYKWYRFFRFKTNYKKPSYTIVKNTGDYSLTIVEAGDNKATLMATLRQITNMDYESAKHVVNNTPYKIFDKISEQEADLNKKALEFVGAKVNIEK